MRRRVISGREVIYHNNVIMKVKVSQARPTLCNPMDCGLQAPLSMEFSRQELECNHPLLQGTFQTQGLKPVSHTAGSSSGIWNAAPRFLSVQPPEVPSAAPPRPPCLQPEARSYNKERPGRGRGISGFTPRITKKHDTHGLIH